MAYKTRTITLENVYWIRITPIHLKTRLMWNMTISHNKGTLKTKVQHVSLDRLPKISLGPTGPAVDNIPLTQARETGARYTARITHQYSNKYRGSYSVAYIGPKEVN